MTIRDLMGGNGVSVHPGVPVAPLQLIIAHGVDIISKGIDTVTDKFNSDAMFTITSGMDTRFNLIPSPDYKYLILGLGTGGKTKTLYKRDAYLMQSIGTVAPPLGGWGASSPGGSSWKSDGSQFLVYGGQLAASNFVVNNLVFDSLVSVPVPTYTNAPGSIPQIMRYLTNTNEMITQQALPSGFEVMSYDITTWIQNGPTPFAPTSVARIVNSIGWSDKWDTAVILENGVTAGKAIRHTSYQVSGNIPISFTSVGNLVIEYDPTGDYLFMSNRTPGNTTSYGALFKQTSISSISLLKNDFGILSSTRVIRSAAWGPDGTYLAILHNAISTPASFILELWKRAGDVLTKVDSITYSRGSTDTGVTRVNCMAFSLWTE